MRKSNNNGNLYISTPRKMNDGGYLEKAGGLVIWHSVANVALATAQCD